MPIASLIKNIAPGLNEVGKIKIGRKGAKSTSSKGNSFQLPQKLDHFIVTTMEEGNDGNFELDKDIMKVIGSEKPKAIPITLLYDDIELNFRSQYSFFKGKSCICRGDGEKCERTMSDGSKQEKQCPCDKLTATTGDRCKINARLSCIINGTQKLGGCWSFRTTSFHSTRAIMSSLALIKQITGGVLAGIPLWLVISPKKATDPTGKMQTIYVVSVEYRGDQQKLMNEGAKFLEHRKLHEIKMSDLQDDARKYLSAKPIEFVDPDTGEIDEHGEEFYPEVMAEFSEPVITAENPAVNSGEKVETKELIAPKKGAAKSGKAKSTKNKIVEVEEVEEAEEMEEELDEREFVDEAPLAEDYNLPLDEETNNDESSDEEDWDF
jgi:hypothetical protein